jgi:hypothetical protein
MIRGEGSGFLNFFEEGVGEGDIEIGNRRRG